MKRKLLATLFALSLSSAVSSYGQGYIIMQNYVVIDGTPYYSGINYGPNPLPSLSWQYVGDSFHVDLLYRLGGEWSFQLAVGSLTGIWPGAKDGGTPTTDGAGIFLGPTVVIPDYVSGPVDFIVRAYNTSQYGDPGGYSGLSPMFAIPSLQTSPLLPPGDLLNVVDGVITGFKWPTPEPSALALLGLGLLTLIGSARRRSLHGRLPSLQAQTATGVSRFSPGQDLV